MTSLRDIDERYQALLEMGENGILDEETFADTLEGIEGEREQKLESCAAVLLQLRSDEKALAAEIQRLRERKQAIENRETWLKNWIKAFGGIEAGKPVRLPIATLYITKRTRVEITGHVPLAWCHDPVPPAPNKPLIKKAIEDGEPIDFAELVWSESVQMR